jgi:hypothetical protein
MTIVWPRHIVLAVLLLLGFHGNAATPPDPAPSPGPGSVASAASGPTIEQVQAKLTALATLRDLPESERTQAQDLYQQAISHLQGAKNHADTLADYQQLQQSAPLETARLQQTLICPGNWLRLKPA